MDMVNSEMSTQDRIRGSLIGGAIGDALGYPVEFLNYSEIQKSYGERGIIRFDLAPYWLDKSNHKGKALVSDDTQMTLFTANGIINAKQKGVSYIEGITQAYLEWLHTQTGQELKKPFDCWLTKIPELNARRAPGNTCITSLTCIAREQTPFNKSKGCGGVMRIAPIPLYAAVNNRMDVTNAVKIAADVAKITHHHPLGYIPAALMAHVIYRLVQDEKPSRANFETYVHEGVDQVNNLYAISKTSLRIMEQLVNTAFELSANNHPDAENIEQRIGGGWVAEETLAIAIYCTHRYFDNFENAIIASVNHSGDSDSTGAVTGNILGAIIGYSAIPQHFKTELELHDVILRIANELLQPPN